MPHKKKLWEKAIKNGDFKAYKHKPVITKSWERSSKFGIDPFKVNNMDDELSPNSVREAKDKYGELIFIATPIMNDLYFRLKGTETALFLIDPEGYILKRNGDKTILMEVGKVRLVEGANWLEKSKGTNGIGTALLEQMPVNILAEEHFCEPFHRFSCFAAPIFDIDKKLLAVLDATVLFNQPCMHLLALVVSAAKAIETQFLSNCLQKQILYNHKKSTAILDSMNCGILWVNQTGHITNSNSHCSNVLKIDFTSLHDRHIEDIFELPATFEEILAYNDIDLSEKFKIKYKGNQLYCHINPILGPLGETLGAAVHLSSNIPTIIPAKPPKQKALFTFENIIGDSESIKTCIRLARRAATTDLTILITGETGTGKEVFARAIHNESNYNKGPFIAINCGAIPETLIESELFGYEEGSFTGAKKGGRPGKFELANNGTIFLDEIGEMPLLIQVNLLRVLQEREIVRVGGSKPVNINVRVIAATNKDLKTEVKKGTFRQDLYYRLNVVNIKIPPLRERRDDIIPLANYLLEKKSFNCKISPPAESVLINYLWPGNVRELENVIERSASFCNNNMIKVNNLPEEVKDHCSSRICSKDEKFKLKDLEARTIIETLSKFGGNCALAAKMLGISRTTLYRKLKHLGIDKEQLHN